MAVSTALFILFLLSNLTHGHTLKRGGEKKLVWPKEYRVKGEKFEFHTDILLPFEIWYSEKYNSARIDLDGGTVKKYYNLDTIDGPGYAIHPVSNDDEVSEMKCYEANIHMSHRYLLLNSTGLKYTGRSTVLFGKQVDEWASTEIIKEIYVRNQTLYVHTTDDGLTLPVRNIEQTYIYLEHGASSHSVIDYHQFETKVKKKDIKLPVKDPQTKCRYGSDLMTDLRFLHPDVPGAVDTAFNSYMNYHNKQYHENDVKSRKMIFEKNWRMVREHNLKNLSFQLAINEFSDRNDDELQYLTGTYESKETLLEYAKAEPFHLDLDKDIELPQNYDSREEGIVTSVKHQGFCGSCWAFATVATVEVAYGKMKGTKLLDLSEQSLVDCGWSSRVKGCQGGDLYTALKQVKRHGLATELEYGGYKAIDGVCNISNMSKIFTIHDKKLMLNNDQDDIKRVIYKYGAVVAEVRATPYMKQYSNGIYYEDFVCEWPNHINHAVTLVGYGVHEGEDYWLVKNSWGDAWGEAGYMRMSVRNCFVSQRIYVPVP